MPAFVRNHRFDMLGANPLGAALYAPMFAAGPVLPVNSMRFNFLSTPVQVACDVIRTSDDVARRTVGVATVDLG